MFGKKKVKRDVKMPPHLTPKEQKQVKAVVEAARRDNGVPRTAQQSIPFQRMFPDGICRVRDNYYTKTIQFQDINYQLAQQEDKTAIFEEWCGFLNFFDSSIHFELSFMNMATDADSLDVYKRQVSMRCFRIFADNTNLLNQLNMLYARACTCSLLAFTILV